MPTQKTISPIDGRVLVERELASPQAISAALTRAEPSQSLWRAVPLTERQAICSRFVEWMEANSEAIGEEITRQMGRPIPSRSAAASQSAPGS
jgi:acyl-CoA reductase-like NAD-dependent aldehyde dehydrogenase